MRARRGLALLVCLAAASPLLAQARKTTPPTLPADMMGSWGREESDCTDIQSDGRLHVTPKTLEYADNRLAISRVVGLTGEWLRVEGLNRESGRRPRRASLELRLRDKDHLLVRTGPNAPEPFVRCKPAQLQG